MNGDSLLAGLTRFDATEADISETQEAVISPTTSLALPMLPHQQEGMERALAFGACLLADDMGLGKTVQGIGVTASAIEAGFRPVVWVVPPSLRTNTEREMTRFAPHLSTHVVVGQKPSCLPDVDVVICGDSVVSHWEETLIDHGIGGVVVDEAHRAKSRTTNRAKSIRALSKVIPKDGPRLLMSGTPIQNHPAELVSLLTILGLIGKFGGPVNYLDRYCPRIPGNRYGMRGIDHDRLSDLHVRLSDLTMVRRTKDEVLELPNKGFLAITLESDAKVAAEYRMCEADLRRYLSEVCGYGGARLARADKAAALVQLTKLRSLAGLAIVESTTQYVTDLLQSTLPGEPQEQVVVFTEHRDVAEALAKSLGCPAIQGGMGDVAKQAAVDGFQSGEHTVLVANSVAGGVGITLTAGRHVVFAELPWHAAAVDQQVSRCHRYGQEREVVGHVVFPDFGPTTEPVTHRMWGLIEAKYGVASAVIDNEVGAVLMDEDMADSLIAQYLS
jgi:SNF2 family DNA or RNA helicase